MARKATLPPAEPFGVKLNSKLVQAITKERLRRGITVRQMYETALVAALGLPAELVAELRLPVVSRESFVPDAELLKTPLTEFTGDTTKSSTLLMSETLVALVRAELEPRAEVGKYRRFVEGALLGELGLIPRETPVWERVEPPTPATRDFGTQTTVSFQTTNNTQNSKKVA